jgi:anti-sigma-K factor RskA
MTCDERQDQIVHYALGTLEPQERVELRAHLDGGCAQCADFLLEIEATLDQLPLAAGRVTPPPHLKERLLKRIEDREATPAPVATVQPGGRQPVLRCWLEALVAGAVAAAIVGGIFWHLVQRERQTIASLRAELARQQAELRQLRQAIQHDTEMIELLQSPSVQLVGLQGTPVQPRSRARVFWDQDRQAWHFFATGLQAPPPGKTYELWLINASQQKLPAGTFDVNAQGEGSLVATSPTQAGRVVALAVTQEPTGGSPQPTGAIQLMGEIR